MLYASLVKRYCNKEFEGIRTLNRLCRVGKILKVEAQCKYCGTIFLTQACQAHTRKSCGCLKNRTRDNMPGRKTNQEQVVVEISEALDIQRRILGIGRPEKRIMYPRWELEKIWPSVVRAGRLAKEKVQCKKKNLAAA